MTADCMHERRHHEVGGIIGAMAATVWAAGCTVHLWASIMSPPHVLLSHADLEDVLTRTQNYLQQRQPHMTLSRLDFGYYILL